MDSLIFIIGLMAYFLIYPIIYKIYGKMLKTNLDYYQDLEFYYKFSKFTLFLIFSIFIFSTYQKFGSISYYLTIIIILILKTRHLIIMSIEIDSIHKFNLEKDSVYKTVIVNSFFNEFYFENSIFFSKMTRFFTETLKFHLGSHSYFLYRIYMYYFINHNSYYLEKQQIKEIREYLKLERALGIMVLSIDSPFSYSIDYFYENPKNHEKELELLKKNVVESSAIGILHKIKKN